MGLKVRKSIKIAPGVKLNVGKKSAGISVGGKGFHYSVNTSGRRTTTVGIPGTGISYSTSSGSASRKRHSTAQANRQRIEREQAKADREQQKKLELEHAKAVVEEYTAKIEAITTIHRFAADTINWETIANLPAPFTKGAQGPKEIEARNELNSYKPGFFAKHIRSLNASVNGTLEKKIADAIEEDKQQYEDWETTHDLAMRVISRDMDAMLEVVSANELFEELAEYGSGFDIGFLDEHTVEVEFDILADSVVPKETATLTSTGKLSQKTMPVTKRLDIMQDYVCSCVLRLIRDLFATLPIDTVLIHAKDSLIDTSVGNTKKYDILSVYAKRENLLNINFDMIDPSDSMTNFVHHMKFLKTKGFQPISRLDVDVT